MPPHRRLYVLAALICAFTLGAVGAYLWQTERAQADLRTSTLHEAERRAGQLASAVAAQMDALMRGVDLGLQQLRRDYGEDPQGFARAVDSVIETLGSDLIDQVSIAGPDGFLTYDSGGLQGSVNISDRRHFRVHADGRGDRLFVGHPVQSRITGRWIIPVTRPIQREGRFAGVVNILLLPDKISAQLARITLDPEDVVVLLHPDGR